MLKLRSRGVAAASIAVLGVGTIAGLVIYSQGQGPDHLYSCNGQMMTAAQVAAHRGIEPEMLDQLHHNRSLEVSEVCAMPQAKLQRAMYRVQNPKPDRPGEWAKLRAMQSQDENGNIPTDGLINAHEQVQAMALAQEARQEILDPEQITKTSWTWLGPGNIGGRIRSLLIHPTSTNTMYIGSVSGGIWKTTNGGSSWTVLNNFLANMAVSTMIMDRNNPAIIYAGTGEGFFNGDAVQGAGIFKSTNNGASWTQLTSTKNNDFLFVNRLANSANNATILAATNSGIFRSTNGGTSWTKVHSIRTLDIDFHPTDSNKAIASGESGKVWRSTNGGQTWTASSGINSSGGFNNRVEVAYAKSNGNIVYASSGFNNGTLYQSTNGGASFTQKNTGNAYLGSQGWYDNALWVDPTNPNVVVVGGIDLWRSTNGGSTLTKISQWFSVPLSAHADQHIIVSHPGYNGTSNTTVFFGNDGGVYKAANVKTVANTSGWQELNNNLGITQFFGAAGHPASGKIIGGTQDNGTLLYTPAGGAQNWTSPFGGDGGWSAADPVDGNYFYGEYVYLQIHRSTNGGASSNYIWAGTNVSTRLLDANSCALFIAPFILDPTNSNRMLAGGCSLWRSNDVKAGTPTWSKIKNAISGSFPISAIAVAPSNADVIYVGYTNGDIYKTTTGTNATPTWTKVDGSLPNRFVTRLTVQKNNPNIVYATFGGYTSGNIWRTTNGGTSWSNRSGSGLTGLPAAPVRSVVIHPNNNNVIYAGTEVGVFLSLDGGAHWLLPTNGPTSTSVDELFFMGTTLVAATHGRGLFKSPTLPLDIPADQAQTEAADSDPASKEN